MKKLLVIIIIFTLIVSSCTQQMTDEEVLQRAEEIEAAQATEAPTGEPTAAPTTAEPISPSEVLRTNTYPFESYYVEIQDKITTENYEILKDLFDTYGIVMLFDDTFANGYYSDSFARLPDDKLDYAISTFNDALNILNPNRTENTTYAISYALQKVYSVDSFFHAGASGGKQIQVGLGSPGINYDYDEIIRNYISEFANNFVAQFNLDLREFESYNKFPKYRSELSAGDEDFVYDVLSPMGNTPEFWDTMWGNGLLSYDGYKNLDDDVAQHFEGAFLNYTFLNDRDDYWRTYIYSYFRDPNQTIFKKANAIMNEWGKANPDWGLKNMYDNYNPYFIEDENFNIDDYVED